MSRTEEKDECGWKSMNEVEWGWIRMNEDELGWMRMNDTRVQGQQPLPCLNLQVLHERS